MPTAAPIAEPVSTSAAGTPDPLRARRQQWRRQQWRLWRVAMAQVWRVALPLMISTLSWTIMNFIDRVLLLGYSHDAVAAALPAAMLFWSLVCFPIGIASYANTFVSQYYGAGRPQQIGPAVWQGIWIGVAAAPVMFALVPFAPGLFELVDHGDAVRPLEVIYFEINAWGAPGMIATTALSAFFTGRGRVLVVMIVDIAGALLNIGLDYCWIYGYYGFPEAGIAGAAWATVIAIWFKTVVYAALFLVPKAYRSEYHTLAGWRPQLAMLGRLSKFGLASGLQLMFEAVAYTFFIMVIGKVSQEALAATTLAFNVNNLAFMPVVGIGLATMTLVGRHMGHRHVERAARSAWSAFALASGYMLAFTVIYLFFPDAVLFFQWVAAEEQPTGALRDTTRELLVFLAIYSLADAMAVVFSSAIKGAGDTWFVFHLAWIVGAVFAGAAWLILQSGQGSLHLLWTLMSAVITLQGFVLLGRFLGGRWRTMEVIEKAEALE
ncbi:MAG: MATE family efflux transporter [Planctomycetes bacterium]|nr:MATE family efflux transporter [Planctomycetota bacterium]